MSRIAVKLGKRTLTMPGDPAQVAAALAKLGYSGLLGKIAAGFEHSDRVVIHKRDTVWARDRKRPKRIVLTRLSRRTDRGVEGDAA